MSVFLSAQLRLLTMVSWPEGPVAHDGPYLRLSLRGSFPNSALTLHGPLHQAGLQCLQGAGLGKEVVHAGLATALAVLDEDVGGQSDDR